MKKPRPGIIILLAVLALVAGSIAYFIYSYQRAYHDFSPPPVITSEVRASPYGTRHARRLLEKLGYGVRLFGVRYDRDHYAIIIRRYDERDDWAAWRAWVEAGRTLVLLGKDQQQTKSSIPARGDDRLLAGVDTLWLDPAISLNDIDLPFAEGETETVLRWNGRALISRTRVGRGEVIRIADASVFNDENIIRGDNAYFLNNCLKARFPSPVVFDESTTQADGTPLDDPLRAGDGEAVFILFREPFLPIFLQSLALGLVFCLVFWKRFGPARDPEQFSRRSLLRHLEAVGHFFEKTKHTGVFADVLDRHFFTRVRALLHFSGASRGDLAAEVKKRLPLSAAEEEAFSIHPTRTLVARDDRREEIILRLKGAKNRHGKSKIAG